VMISVQAPVILHHAGAEDEGPARSAVQRQAMGSSAWRCCVSVVSELLRNAFGRRRHVDQSGGSKAVIHILIPLVTHLEIPQGRALAGLERGHTGVPPEAHL